MKYKIFGSLLVVIVLIILYALINSGQDYNPEGQPPPPVSQ